MIRDYFFLFHLPSKVGGQMKKKKSGLALAKICKKVFYIVNSTLKNVENSMVSIEGALKDDYLGLMTQILLESFDTFAPANGTYRKLEFLGSIKVSKQAVVFSRSFPSSI